MNKIKKYIGLALLLVGVCTFANPLPANATGEEEMVSVTINETVLVSAGVQEDEIVSNAGVNKAVNETVVIEKENPYVYEISDEDRLLFEQIIAAEAYSFWSEEDCLTLATVIINRMNCEFEFEDTIRGVLTEKRQFETYSNKRYLEVEVFEAAKNAVDRALKGETNVNSDILYFCTKEYYDTLDDPKRDFFLTLGDVDYQVRNVVFFEAFE